MSGQRIGNKVNKWLTLFLIIILGSQALAFQDCLITTDGKFSDISIENNKLVDVYPLVTVMNEKNTLVVHPLDVGSTRFCVLKNNKNIMMFNVKIEKDKTYIEEVDGCEILPIDSPDDKYDDERFELDKPPR